MVACGSDMGTCRVGAVRRSFDATRNCRPVNGRGASVDVLEAHAFGLIPRRNIPSSGVEIRENPGRDLHKRCHVVCENCENPSASTLFPEHSAPAPKVETLLFEGSLTCSVNNGVDANFRTVRKFRRNELTSGNSGLRGFRSRRLRKVDFASDSMLTEQIPRFSVELQRFHSSFCFWEKAANVSKKSRCVTPHPHSLV